MPSKDLSARNRILANLSSEQRARVLQKVEHVSFEIRQTLYDQDEPIKAVWFPLSGVFSMVSTTEDGTTIEVATVGNEGMVGLPLFFMTDSIPLRMFAQIPGDCLKLSVKDFRSITAEADGELTWLLHRYTQALFNQVAQHAACNGVHPVELRCARWLLMTHDRVGSDTFPLTQEFLAMMLGVRRASVTDAAAYLQQKGLITYSRGIVTVLNRKGLEAASCEHYGLVAKEYDRLLIPKPQGA